MQKLNVRSIILKRVTAEENEVCLKEHSRLRANIRIISRYKNINVFSAEDEFPEKY